ncbi:MAG: adenylate/guanylate cyclase domain-containing protein [Planctomycetota bacterium]
MAKLEVISGPQAGFSYSLGGDRREYTIGRNPANPVVMMDMNASRNHARINVRPDGFYLEDLGSSNGTFMGGRQLSVPVKLTHRSEFKIGATVFRFEEHEGAPAPSPFPDPLASKPSAADDFGQSFVQMLDGGSGGNMDLVLGENPEDSVLGVDAGTEAFQAVSNRLKILYKVSEDIGTVLNLDEVIEKIMDSIFEVFPQADRGFVMFEDPATGEMVPKVIRKRGAKPGEQIKVSVSKTIIQTAFKEKKSILSSDAMGDDRFAEGLSIVNFGIRSMMCSPLFVGEEKLGVIHLDTQDQSKRFTPDDLSMLQGIGRQAAISIKNAKLVADIAAETQKRNSLQRFLSPDIADRVLTGEIDLKLGGDAKFGSVFFSDIIGFTRMASILPPEVVVAHINRYFNIMIGIIFHYNGTINKFQGDAIMAIWGLMSEPDDQCPQVAAVEASIDMQNALFDFNYGLIEEGQKPIQMGVGLNTGGFLAGNVGSEQQMEYTVIGDNVNLASRIQSKATRGQIYISDSTFERVKGRIYALKMQPVHIKGKEEPVQMYGVRGFRDREFNKQTFDRLTLPCSYLDTEGQKHNGLINGYSRQDGVARLFAHFRRDFAPGMEIELGLDLPEIREAGAVRCLVEQHTVVNQETGTKFFNYTLRLVQGSPFFDSLIADYVVQATVSADSIKRE